MTQLDVKQKAGTNQFGIKFVKALVGDGIEGIVEDFSVKDHLPTIIGYVIRNTVYELKIGKQIPIGLVKDGKAYKHVDDGPPQYIGDVKYCKDNK